MAGEIDCGRSGIHHVDIRRKSSSHEFFHFFPGPKRYDLPLGNGDLVASAGVPANARGARLDFEDTEVAELPALPLR